MIIWRQLGETGQRSKNVSLENVIVNRNDRGDRQSIGFNVYSQVISSSSILFYVTIKL